MNWINIGFNLLSLGDRFKNMYNDGYEAYEYLSEIKDNGNILSREGFLLALKVSAFLNESFSIMYIVKIRSVDKNSILLNNLQQKLVKSEIMILVNSIFINIMEKKSVLTLDNCVKIGRFLKAQAAVNNSGDLAALGNLIEHLRDGRDAFCWTKEKYDLINQKINEYKYNMIPLEFENLQAQFAPIPIEYHDNHVFKKYKCAINQFPIRYPLAFVHTPCTLFEKEAIIQWMNQNNNHPTVPNLPIHFSELRVRQDILKEIEGEIKQLNILENPEIEEVEIS